MTGTRSRRLFTALSMAAAIGLFSCFGTAAANTQDTTAGTPEEQDTTDLDLQAALNYLRTVLETLRADLYILQAELAIFRQERADLEDARRKSLTPRLPLGLSRSTAGPFYSRRPADDEVICTAIGCAPDAPLEDLLLWGQNRLFAPLTSTLRRTFSGDQRGTVRTDDFYVRTISGDGADGFRVSYVADGIEDSVHFGADGFDTPECSGCYYVKDKKGREYWFWSFYEELTWADVYGGSFPGGDRPYFIFGARTESGKLPAGSASYFGRMYAEAYKRDDPDHNQRVEMGGRIALTADLDESTLHGAIRALWSRPRRGQWSFLSDTSAHFKIAGGTIVDGQFTASLIGMGDEDAAAGDTVRGYKGGILGEFYGPAAEEVGGVLSAGSDTHDRVLAGHFGAKKLDSAVPEGDLSFLSSAVHRDFSRSRVTLSSTAEVTAIESDGAGGYRVTYSVGGVKETVHLDAANDLGSFPTASTSYHERIGDRSYFLWNPDSYSAVPEFDHFDVRAWTMIDWKSGTTDPLVENRGFSVYGAPTDAADLPSGTATYAGRVFAEAYPPDNPNRSARSSFRGRLTLNADFGAGTVGGRLDRFEVRQAGSSTYGPPNDNVANISNGKISNNKFTAGLTSTVGFSGDMAGHFYGPAAEEVGGVWSGTNSVRNTVVHGFFGGSKQ